MDTRARCSGSSNCNRGSGSSASGCHTTTTSSSSLREKQHAVPGPLCGSGSVFYSSTGVSQKYLAAVAAAAVAKIQSAAAVGGRWKPTKGLHQAQEQQQQQQEQQQQQQQEQQEQHQRITCKQGQLAPRVRVPGSE